MYPSWCLCYARVGGRGGRLEDTDPPLVSSICLSSLSGECCGVWPIVEFPPPLLLQCFYLYLHCSLRACEVLIGSWLQWYPLSLGISAYCNVTVIIVHPLYSCVFVCAILCPFHLLFKLHTYSCSAATVGTWDGVCVCLFLSVCNGSLIAALFYPFWYKGSLIYHKEKHLISLSFPFVGSMALL